MAGARTGRLFLGYYLLWGLCQLPALARSWWFLDDFGIAEVFAPANVEHHLEQGRPGQFLWMTTFLLDGVADRTAANVALRLGQGALHAFAAALVAVLLWRETGRPATRLAGLPFLLWPYAGEVVLWRAAGQYPLAALLSLAGVVLLVAHPRSRPAWLGAASLLAAALLTHQLAAMAGLVAWGIATGLASFGDRPQRHRVREAAALAAGYGAGALASFAVAWTSRGDPFRLDPATSFSDRLLLVADLNRGFFASGTFYPAPLAALQVALLGLGLLAPMLSGAGRPRRRALAGLAVAATLITPYAALLPVAETYVSWRLFYLAPLALSAAFAVAEAAQAGRVVRGAAFAALAGLLAGYAPLAWRASAAYPRLFEADLKLLRELESLAKAHASHDVCVVTPARLRPSSLNPHGIDFRWGGVKLSAFLGAARPFLRWFTPLEMIEEEPILARCVEACAAPAPRGHFRLLVLPDGLPSLCPP